MKAITTIAAVALFGLSSGMARAEERNIADGLAASGEAFAAKGNVAQAKDMLYKALVHDENCPDALYELARITEKEDVSLAADLYQRAFAQYTLDNKPASAAKRSDAEKRMRALNPAAPKLTAAYEDYAQDLDKVVKKLTDNLTETSAMERINDLKLATLVTADKMPKFFTAAQEKKATPPTPPSTDTGNGKGNNPGNGTNPRNRFGRTEENPKNGTTAPEVEKELKALGWSTVSGQWVKKGANSYEATDAKLEAQKTNGSIDLWIVKDPAANKDTGVKVSVRTDAQNAAFPGFGGGGGPTTNEMTGYGIHYEGKDFREFGFADRNRRGAAGRGGQPNNGPSEVGRHNTTDGRNHFLVKIDEANLEIYHNDSRNYNVSSAKITKNGTFIVDVNGTVVIEMPKVTGQ